MVKCPREREREREDEQLGHPQPWLEHLQWTQHMAVERTGGLELDILLLSLAVRSPGPQL